MKKIMVMTLAAAISVSSMSYSFAKEETIWDTMRISNEREASGNLEGIDVQWKKLYSYYTTESLNETNAALYAKKLGKYYDERKKYDEAVKYYELEDKHWNAAGHPWGAEDMERANEIRSYINMFEKTKELPNYKLAKYEPKAGMYVGIYSENDGKIGQDIEKTKDVYGEHNIYLFYQEYNQRFTDGFGNSSALDMYLGQKIKDIGGSFQVSLNSKNGLNAVEKNDWLIEWAKDAKNLDIPIYLRFLPEMNGNWIPWHGNPKLYIEKFKLVHDVMAEYAPNVVMVWCPGDVPIEMSGHRIEDYYPGDEYLDWVGVNFYVDYYNSGDVTKKNNHLQNPLSHLEYIYDLYAHKKPIMIGETGVAHLSVPNNQDVTNWAVENLEKLYTYIPIKYPRVKGITYFSVDQGEEHNKLGNEWSNYEIGENAKFEEKYKEVIKSGDIISKVGENLNHTYKQIFGEEIRNAKEIYFEIKIPDYKVSKIEFYEGNKLIDTQSKMPYKLNKNFNDISDLSIKVYDSNEELVLKKQLYNFDRSKLEKQVIEAQKIEVVGESNDSNYPFVKYEDTIYMPLTWTNLFKHNITFNWNATNGNDIDYKVLPKFENINMINEKIELVPVINSININGNFVENSNLKSKYYIYNGIVYMPVN